VSERQQTRSFFFEHYGWSEKKVNKRVEQEEKSVRQTE